MERIAPIFAVRDLAVAMDFYEPLGFAVRRYSGGAYGFASRRGTEIHLGVLPDGDRRISAAYLFVEDADQVAAVWESAGADVHRPRTPSGDNTRASLSTQTQCHPLRLSDALTRPTDRTDLRRSLHPRVRLSAASRRSGDPLRREPAPAVLPFAASRPQGLPRTAATGCYGY